MGIDIYSMSNNEFFEKINSEIFEELYKFRVETTIITLQKNQVKRLINKAIKEKNKDKLRIYQQILEQFEKTNSYFLDFAMS